MNLIPIKQAVLSLLSASLSLFLSAGLSLLATAQVRKDKFTSDSLAAVTVLAKRPFVEFKIDKVVVNVASSPASAGQSALEVLERSPGVSVEPRGVISINGKPGAKVYINGRPAYLSGPDLLTYLRGLPAIQLDQIEILSQPSARYDAAGTGGIINILLKSNREEGLNGSVTHTSILGFYYKTRDNIILNLKKDKFSFSLSYSFSDYKNFSDHHTERSYRADFTAERYQVLEQHISSISSSLTHIPRIAVDYQASKNATLGLGVNGLFNTISSGSTGLTNTFDSMNNRESYELSSRRGKSEVSKTDLFGYFSQRPDKKGRELGADADYVLYRNTGRQGSDNYIYSGNGSLQEPYLLDSYLPAALTLCSFKSYYAQPLTKSTRLEGGIKSSYIKSDNNAQYSLYDTLQKKMEPDTAMTNHFIYQENINAAYLNLTRKLGKKWNVQTGLRFEQTRVRGNELATGSRFSRNYNQFFPTAFVSYALNHSNNFSASYGRRINRPNFQDLNPFPFIVDRYTIREGNPYLQPEFANNIEANYNYKGQLSFTVNYINFNNIFTNVVRTLQQDNNLVTLETKENINARRNIFLALVLHQSPFKWWTLNFSGVVYNSRLSVKTPDLDTVTAITAYRLNLDNQFHLNNGWDLELSGYYMSRRVDGVLVYLLPAGSLSLGAGKKILKDKATLTFNLNDPFEWYRPGQTEEASTFTAGITSRPESRYLSVTLSYRFGKPIQQQKRKKNDSGEDEQSRVDF